MKNTLNSMLKRYGIFFVIAVVLSACGLGKMVKKHNEVVYKVSPNPLEVHSDRVPVKVSVKYPAKYFNKKATVEVAPTIKYEGGEAALKPAKLIGESVEGDGIKVSFEGGSITYTDTIDYKPEMKKSELMVKATASLGSKSKELGSMTLGEGCIITSTRVNGNGDVLVGKDAYEKETVLSRKATIFYLIQQSNVRGSETNSRSMKELRDFVKKGYEAKGVDLYSYASPDGPEDLNTKLVGNREKNAYSFISKELKKLGFKKATDEASYQRSTTAEDWAGFQKLLSESDMQDKDVILKILNSYSDPVAREKEIKNLTSAYNKLRTTILPELRRSEITINVLEPKLTDEQILAKAKSKPDTLKREELAYAATLTNDWDEKLAIYESFAKLYADDWRGFNNLGYVYLMKGDLAKAASSLEKANGMSANNGVILNNLGIVAMRNRNFTAAEDYFNKAQANGQNQGKNLGALYIKKADYVKAVEFLGKNTCSYNAALANLLAGNNDNAVSSIKCVETKDAAALYLAAIIGARTANDEMTISNLKMAVEKNANYKADAASDLEFKKYWNNADFQEAIK